MVRKYRFGKAFIDEVKKVSSASSLKKIKEEKDWNEALLFGWEGNLHNPSLSIWRKMVFLLLVIVLFATLFFKIFTLQVVEGAINRQLADANRIQLKIIHAQRGVIYDRNGKILALNEPGFRLSSEDKKQVEYLTYDQAIRLEIENDSNFNNLEVDSLRAYPQGAQTAHIVGYLGEINEEELKDSKFLKYEHSSTSYKMGDRVGRLGTEQTYESILKGIDGGIVIEIDAKGQQERVIRESKSTPGQNLYLTIDSDLQSFSYQRLDEAIKKSGSCCGALVASDPTTGEILSLVSIPSFEPEQPDQALSNPNSPFLNRVISGTYPPGSVFKIASALAGLGSGKINAQTQFQDTGKINLGQFSFSNWYFTQYGKKEGSLDLVKALKRSNDIYFYKLGELIGEQALGSAALELGLGKKLGIDLKGEASGNIPDNDWKVKVFDQVWYPGDTLHMAIGQGFVLTTPLQLNNLISLVAGDGKQYPLHLAKKITNQEGEVIKEFKYDPSEVDSFTREQFALIRKGLEEVPKDGGTAWPFFNFPFATAGKTGTAEVGDAKGSTHAWYSAYAPAKDPKIAITVLIESGGEGSSVAAPVAKEVLRWFLSPDKNNLVKDISPIASESARTLGE